jgi:hypothetical protein
MQSVRVAVPYENALGGFALFAPAGAQLGPELYGFYGRPAINPTNESAVYLVGNNFSVRGTRVLVGGVASSNFTLLSRQLIELRFSGPLLVENQELAIRVATPYGVTREIKVPVVLPPPPEDEDDKPPQPEETPVPANKWNWVGPVLHVQVVRNPSGLLLRPADGHQPSLACDNPGPFLPRVQLALRFLVRRGEDESPLTFRGEEYVRVLGADRETSGFAVAETGRVELDFSRHAWPKIAEFLGNSLNPTNLPSKVRAETLLNVDGKRKPAGNALEIRLHPK